MEVLYRLYFMHITSKQSSKGMTDLYFLSRSGSMSDCKTSSLSGLPTNPNSPQRNSINTIQEIG